MVTIVRILFVGVASIVAACGMKTGAKSAGGSTSGLSTVEVAVPAATADVFGAAAQLEQLTHVHFLVLPVDPTCAKATTINNTVVYNIGSIGDTVYNGCDYELTLSMGSEVKAPADVVAPAPIAPLGAELLSAEHQKQASQKIRAVYTNFKAVAITSKQLKDSGGKLTIPVTLDLTQFGQQHGFTSQVKTGDSVPNETQITKRDLTADEVKLDLTDGKVALIGTHQIKSANEWINLSASPLTAVDWTKSMVVGFTGNAAGKSAAVETIVDNGSEVVVTIKESTVENAPTAEVAYFAFAEIPVQTKPIRFEIK